MKKTILILSLTIFALAFTVACSYQQNSGRCIIVSVNWPDG